MKDSKTNTETKLNSFCRAAQWISTTMPSQELTCQSLRLVTSTWSMRHFTRAKMSCHRSSVSLLRNLALIYMMKLLATAIISLVGPTTKKHWIQELHAILQKIPTYCLSQTHLCNSETLSSLELMRTRPNSSWNTGTTYLPNSQN